MKFKLKKDLLLGTATAATQIEGGDDNNNGARLARRARLRTAHLPCVPTTIMPVFVRISI